MIQTLHHEQFVASPCHLDEGGEKGEEKEGRERSEGGGGAKKGGERSEKGGKRECVRGVRGGGYEDFAAGLAHVTSASKEPTERACW